MRFPLRDADTIPDPIAWMENNSFARGQSGYDFCYAVVALADCDRRHLRAALANCKDSPRVALTKERGNRNGEGIVAAPSRDMDNDPVIVTQASPDFGSNREVHCRAHALLFVGSFHNWPR